MDAPKLRNPEWQAAFEETLPHLDRFQDQLNAISEDLRAVEKALTESGFRIETSIQIENGDSLSWMETGKNAWRICLVEWISDNDRSFKPLIETPASERWRAAGSVPRLLREIGVIAGRDPDRAESSPAPIDDEIPF